MRIDAEEEARHMMSRTQVIVDNAAAVVFLKDTEGRYLLVNRKWESVTGIDRKKAIGVHAEELHPVHIARQLLLNDKEVIESRTPIEREEVVEREGRKQVFLVAKSPLFDNKGRVYGLCGVATDITQRKELERSLKELTHRLEVAQRIAKIGNWDWNISTGLSWWSKETFRLFGLPPSDPAPDRAAILAMIHPDDVESVKRAVAKCIADRSPYRMTYRVPQADGTIRVVEVHGEPVLDESGKPYLLVGTIQDVTARERN